MVNKVKEKGYVIIWFAFLIYLICQHNLVWMHFDDYGYATLNYAVSVGTVGNNYGILDIIKYLYLHYMEWGGRVLFYGIQIVVYHYLGLEGMRVAQSVLIWMVFIIVFMVVKKSIEKANDCILSLIICLLYGIFQTGIMKDGLYWFAASTGYVWPIPFLLVAAYQLYSKSEREIHSKRFIILNSICWFTAAFSQEQIAIAAIVMCVGVCIYGVLKQKQSVIYYIMPIISTLSGALIMLLAPGNLVRLSTGEHISLFEQMMKNVPYLITFLIIEGARIFILLVMICIAIATYMLIKSSQFNTMVKILLKVYLVVISCAASAVIVYRKNLAEWGIMHIDVMFIIGILIGIIIMTIFLVQRAWYFQLICLYGAICCYGAMSFVPAIPYRVLLPFIFLLLPVIASVLSFEIVDTKKMLFTLPLWLMLCGNIIYVYNGYSVNQVYQELNWNNLENAQKMVAEGQEITEVYLKKMPNEEFTGPMSYVEAFSWSEILIRNYFELPISVELIWQDN